MVTKKFKNIIITKVTYKDKLNNPFNNYIYKYLDVYLNPQPFPYYNE